MGGKEILVISSHREATLVVVTLVGELDMAGTAPLATEVQRALSDPTTDALEIDMHGLSFADSAGLQAMLAAQEATRLAGVAFRLAGISPVVRRVIHLAGVDRLLLPTAEDAGSS
jgi:anti-sigma B factor antagonist